MMSCRILLLACTLLVAAPLGAQMPQGWKMWVDRSTNPADPDAPGNVMMMEMGGGYHVVAPSGAVFWKPTNTVTGEYTLKATFTLNKPSGHVNTYGLVFGGDQLDAAGRNFIYFLIGQDGRFLIKHWAGTATHDVQAKTAHASIKTPDASGKSANTLEVRVLADKIDYVINDAVVHSTPKSGMTSKTDGIYGFRINHQLDVMVTGLGVAK